MLRRITLSNFLLAAFISAAAVTAAGSAQAQFIEQERLDAAQKAYNEKNYTQAFYLWLSLAQAGNRGAMFNIGRMYILGEGAPRDNIEAYKWMHLAAELGQSDAAAARARLSINMSLAEIKEAEGRAEEWRRANPF